MQVFQYSPVISKLYTINILLLRHQYYLLQRSPRLCFFKNSYCTEFLPTYFEAGNKHSIWLKWTVGYYNLIRNCDSNDSIVPRYMTASSLFGHVTSPNNRYSVFTKITIRCISIRFLCELIHIATDIYKKIEFTRKIACQIFCSTITKYIESTLWMK